jgi:hypothetical protein
MVPTLKISSISPRKKYFWYLPYLSPLCPEDEQTSKHGGGGRYDAILEFKEEQIKKFMRKKKKERTSKKKKERNKNMRKRKRNISMCNSKNKVNSPVL